MDAIGGSPLITRSRWPALDENGVLEAGGWPMSGSLSRRGRASLWSDQQHALPIRFGMSQEQEQQEETDLVVQETKSHNLAFPHFSRNGQSNATQPRVSGTRPDSFAGIQFILIEKLDAGPLLTTLPVGYPSNGARAYRRTRAAAPFPPEQNAVMTR
jgi:hypothetical protein